MKTAFIFHGSFANSHSHWFEWLEAQLTDRGFKVMTPNFPTPNEQSLSSWEEVFNKYRSKFTEDSVIIAHDIGAAFAMRVIETLGTTVDKLLLVAPISAGVNNPAFDKINNSFYTDPFNYQTIVRKVNQIVIFAGDNDPIVPKRMVETLSKNLQADLQYIGQGGHLDTAANMSQFDPVLPFIDTPSPQKIKPLIRPSGMVASADQPVLHNFHRDLSNAMKDSSSKVVVEAMRKTRQANMFSKQLKELKSTTILYSVVMVLLIIIAITAIVFGSMQGRARFNPTSTTQTSNPNALIPADQFAYVSFDGQVEERIAALAQAIATPAPAGTVTQLVITQNQQPLDFMQAFQQVGAAVPAGIVESQGGMWMYGQAFTRDDSGMFMAFPIRAVTRANQGLQDWLDSFDQNAKIMLNLPDYPLGTQVSFVVTRHANQPIQLWEDGLGNQVWITYLNEQTLVIGENLDTLPVILDNFRAGLR